MSVGSQSLIRKQYLVSQRNVSKLERLAKRKGISATAIVREAIEAYDPEGLDVLGERQLMTLVATRLKEAIKDTQATRKKLHKTLKTLGTK
jgi:predicted DNA-binding protein